MNNFGVPRAAESLPNDVHGRMSEDCEHYLLWPKRLLQMELS